MMFSVPGLGMIVIRFYEFSVPGLGMMIRFYDVFSAWFRDDD
jgi:hypothetical protein